MNLISDNYFDCLSGVQDAISARLTLAQAVTDGSEPFHFAGGVSYGATVRASAPLVTLRGKTTKKYAHAVVYRLETGRYELTFYIA